MRILISNPDLKQASLIEEFFSGHGHACKIARVGSECLSQVQAFDAMIVDLDSKNVSGLEIIKHFHVNSPKTRVLLTIKDHTRKDELGIPLEDMKKLGAFDVIVGPYSPNDLSAILNEENEPVAPVENDKLFQMFVRLQPQTYVNLVGKLDPKEALKVKKHLEDSKLEYVYYKINNQSAYTALMTELAEKTSAALRSRMVRDLCDDYIGDVLTSGIRAEVAAEARQMVNNMFMSFQKEPGLLALLEKFEEASPASLQEMVLTSFYATIISRQLDPTSQRTAETVSTASLLLDIGKLKFSQDLINKDPEAMDKNDLVLYHAHPRLGFEMLSQFAGVSEPVRQIVLQHHEYVSGEGFPNHVFGPEIYPLAKIVSFANAFSRFVIKAKTQPIEVLKLILPDRKIILRYDANVVKALVTSFLKATEKKAPEESHAKR